MECCCSSSSSLDLSFVPTKDVFSAAPSSRGNALSTLSVRNRQSKTKIRASLSTSYSRFHHISPKLLPLGRLVDSSRFKWSLRAADDDFEIEEEIEFDDDEKDEEEEEDIKDFETDYDIGKFGEHERSVESDSFVSTQGEAAESVVEYKINEDEFHKISLQHCDFFIRKVPDPDDDVYDFREIYVTAPDTDVYAIPRTDGKLPKKPVRLTKSNHEHICTTELPVEALRSPMVRNERQVMKVFLMKHYKNRRTDAWNFVLDFEQIYIIDSKTKSLSRAKVTLNVPEGVNRDRHDEVLLVHDDGNTFTVVPQSKRKTPDQVVHERYWNKTKKDMENYLRSYRDYPVSNWF